MKNLAILTEEQILGFNQPEELYSRDACESEWRKLRSLWHTDKSEANRAVFQKCKRLYELALENLGKGVWNIPGEIHFTEIKTGKEFAVTYRRKHTFELGEVYIGNTVVAYALSEDNADLFKHGVAMIKSLKYPDDKIKKEALRYMPQILATIDTVDRRVLVLKKDPDTISLRDLFDYLGGSMDSKHVAWVISRLSNIHCILKLSGIMHGDISLDTCFVSPTDHRIALLGGWWYAQTLGSPIKALPPRTLGLDLIKEDKPRAEARITSELILSVGRELLGDINGAKLMMNKSLKQPMLLWLRRSPTGDALKEYATWYNEILKAAFGKREFIILDAPINEIYKVKK
jgi:hypothetical protein